MKRLLALIVLAASVPVAAQSNAAGMVRRSIDAMGGESALKSIRNLKVESMSHAYALEQSERPEGPHLVTYQQTVEIRDQEHQRLWRKQEQRNWSIPNWMGPVMVAADGAVAISFAGRWGPHLPQQAAKVREDLELAPERLLLTALGSADLRVAADRTLHGLLNHAVSFTHNGARHTLYLNAHTMMPTMLQSVQDDEFGIWGDVTRERWYTFWTLQPGGWQYPQQITSTWNGTPWGDLTVFSLKVNEALDEKEFAIPDEAKARFKQMLAQPQTAGGMQSARLDAAKAIEITPDVVLFPGAWNVTLVRQPDGIVVLEAPIGSEYSKQVIDAAATKFPGARIKAVVSTSDAWPHIGGVSEYAVRGIPVYALDLNLPILRRLMKSRKADFRPVAGKVVMGSGDSRIELLPVRGEGSERMMMAYLPAIKGLYASDLLQYNRDRTSFFNPVYPAELAAAVAREGLGVSQTWAMHMAPIPWSKVVDALAAIRAAK